MTNINKIIDLDTLELKISMDEFKKYLEVNEDRRFGYSMRVEVVKYEDMWQEIKNSAMFTIGKDTGKYPNDAWKKKMLLSEHSPIRDGYFILNCYDIPSFVIGHIVRHFNGIEKYVQSLREDRADWDEVPNRNTLQNVRLRINYQAFINISRRRLCSCASKETREFWKLILDSIGEYEPILKSVCVRECVYRGFCPEQKKDCKYVESEAFKKEVEEYRRGL